MGAWIFLLLAPFAFASSELAHSREWLNLLHYRSSLLGQRSTVDGPDFFLSPEGKIDPEKEMDASLAAFRAGAAAKPVGPLKQAPLCAFPARRHFLEENLHEKFPELPCKEFTDWQRGLGAERAVYVFSSAYPNNPAAMFGHTLLRLDHGNSAGREKLLSYGVAFSANIPAGIDDFRYGLYGLLGGFEGFFSLAPYYTMVNDYTNSEIRDLWEYPLALSPRQVHTLVDHLWELYSTTYFDYYFFTENCTTQLLALMQVAIPEADLFRGLPWYILPIDSIHQLKKLGLIGEPVHRPSIKKKLTAAYATLTKPEQREFAALADGKLAPESETNPAVLDVAAAYWNYKKFLGKNLKDSPEQAELRRVLLRRAILGKETPRPVTYSRLEQPDLGHYSSAAGLGYRYAEQESRIQLNYRLGMHDLLDSPVGFEANSQIDFLAGALNYLPERKKFRLEELRFFEVTSLFPWDAYDQKLSWKLSGRLEETRKVACDTCRRGVLEGGGGLSAHLFGEKDLWYSLVLARAAYASRTRWDLGLGSESGLLFRFTPKHSTRLTAKGEWDFLRSFNRPWFWTLSYTQAYSFNQRWEVRGNFDFIPRPGGSEKSGGVRGIYFF
jgi:hypothetical protein